MGMINEVKAAATGRVPALVQSWLPDGQRSDRNWLVCNPMRDDKKASLSVSLDSGAFFDFASGDKGSDVIALRAYLDRSDQGTAARKIADELGIALAHKEPRSSQAVEVIQPVPEVAPPLPESFGRMGKPSAMWCYRDAEGRRLFYQARFERESGKEFRPVSYCRIGNGERFEWRLKGPAAPRPLYGLDRLAGAPDAVVLVVEGEKAADAACRLMTEHGYVAVSPMNGAQSPGRADWSPVAGRRVCIWPDNDEPGKDFAAKIAGLATAAAAASVAVVELPPGLPPKWDLADPLPEGVDPVAIADSARGYKSGIVDEIAKAGGEMQEPFVLLRRAAVLDGKERKPGVYVRQEDEDKETGEIEIKWLWLSSPIEVLADARDGGSKNWGRWLAVVNADGIKHRWPMPAAYLASNSGEVIREELLSLGARISAYSQLRQTLHHYLCIWRASRRVRCAVQPGWFDGVYVLPDRAYGPGHGDVIFQPEGKAPELVKRGTLAGWRTKVAALCPGNDRLVLAVCTALAGPMLRLIGEPTGGFHLRGPSSIGKSKALLMASSVVGCGGQADTWRKTDNALEVVARMANDGLLVLDEIGEGDARAVSAAVYMLANERGKARMTRAGGIREPLTWRLSFISSGEIGIADKLAEAGLRARAGQQIRCLDIEADAGAGLGLFQSLHGEINGDRFARRIDEAVSQEQGTALRAWVELIANDMDAIRQRILDARDRFQTTLDLPDNVDGQIHRAASRFAVLAAVGEVAREITGWPEGTALDAMAALLRGWIKCRGTGRHEDKEAVETVRLYIEQYGDARFTDPWTEQANQDAEDENAEKYGRAARQTPKARAFQRAGFKKINDDNTADYLILPDVWRADVCAGLDAGLVAKTLKRKGFLETDPDGRYTRNVRIPGIAKTSRVYWVCSTILETSP